MTQAIVDAAGPRGTTISSRRGRHASLREQKLIGALRMRDGLVRAKQTVRACHRCRRGGRSGSCPFACGRPPTSPGGVGQLRYEDIYWLRNEYI